MDGWRERDGERARARDRCGKVTGVRECGSDLVDGKDAHSLCSLSSENWVWCKGKCAARDGAYAGVRGRELETAA